MISKSAVVKLVEDNEELQRTYKIREVVFVEEQKVSREEEFDEFESVCKHFLATIDGESAGAARWRETEKGVKLERFAVLKEFRGLGVGSALVAAVMDDISKTIDNPKGKCYLHAQLEAMPLYAKFGFKPQGDQFLECDIVHQTMLY